MKITDTSVKVTNIYFVPMGRHGNFVGFVSFTYSGINFKGISVNETPERDRMWLDYPKDLKFDRVFAGPADKETHLIFESAVQEYLKDRWNGSTITGQIERKSRYAKSKEISTERKGSGATESTEGT